MLWNDSLVMIDQETESLWSHLLGKAMRGPLVDTELETIPSVLTDWETWRQNHPETTACIMPRTAQHHRRLEGFLLQRLCIGLSDDDQTRCWTFALMSERPVINDQLGNRRILVVFDQEHGTAMLYDRRVADRELTFEADGETLSDRETGSEWDLVLGVATAGELKGSRLHQLPGIVSYIDRWRVFHPEGEVVDADD